jgi:integrase
MQRPLIDINLWVVEKWRSQELRRGKAKTTINRDTTALKACLSKAVEWEILDVSPLQKLKPIRTDGLTRARYLTATEETALRNALAQREERLRKNRTNGNAWRCARHQAVLPDLSTVAFADYLQPMVLLTVNTGLRRGEVLQLRWTDVDMLQRKLLVRGDNAKNGKTRHIPLNNEALTTLRKWRSDSPSTEWVFAGRGGERMRAVKTSWKRVLRSAAIIDFRWHDLRHHFASQLVMKAVDLNTVRELLGHSDLTMTLRYAHLSPEHKADAVAKLCEPDEREDSAPLDVAASG